MCKNCAIRSRFFDSVRALHDPPGAFAKLLHVWRVVFFDNLNGVAASHDLTYSAYLEGAGQTADQLVIWNSERQLVGPAYRWIALNGGFAKGLGWVPSPSRPFEWLNESGSLMVKSIFWRDGWIGLEPPALSHWEKDGLYLQRIWG